MCIGWGIYVDGTWHEWLPTTSCVTHGWKTSEDAVREWKLHGKVIPYLNGREAAWGQNLGSVRVDSKLIVAPVVQRVWFPIVEPSLFDLIDLAQEDVA